MTFQVIKASDDDFKETIDVVYAEDLWKLRNKYGHDLILMEAWDDDDTPTIAIYDDYIE